MPDAIGLANRIITKQDVPKFESTGMVSGPGSVGTDAQVVSMHQPVGDEPWTAATVAQPELLRVLLNLRDGQLRMPDSDKESKVDVVSLSKIGRLGYDIRGIHNAYRCEDRKTPSCQRGFWNHDCNAVRTMSQNPNSYLVSKNDRLASKVWETASRILIAERIRADTQRAIAIRVSELVVANTFWTFVSDLSEEQQKAIMLWLNSSLGIGIYYLNRVITEGSFFNLKKGVGKHMPILNVTGIESDKILYLSSVYDRISCKDLKSISKLDEDSTRIEIDDALSKTLQLPNLKELRIRLAREPGICGRT